MPDWKSITVSVSTHLIFRYQLPLIHPEMICNISNMAVGHLYVTGELWNQFDNQLTDYVTRSAWYS